jgi:hypothetical protein
MSYSRGDVALVYSPHSDLYTIKLRPVLVIQADNLNTDPFDKLRTSPEHRFAYSRRAADRPSGVPSAGAGGAFVSSCHSHRSRGSSNSCPCGWVQR